MSLGANLWIARYEDIARLFDPSSETHGIEWARAEMRGLGFDPDEIEDHLATLQDIHDDKIIENAVEQLRSTWR